MTDTTMSYSRTKVREFVKLPNNAEMEIVLDGHERAAFRFLQAMRMELSRLRNEVRRRGKTVKPFTLSLIKIEENLEKNKVTLTIWKKAEHTKLAKEISDIFDDIAGGELL